jgi:hypothetical protein
MYSWNSPGEFFGPHFPAAFESPWPAYVPNPARVPGGKNIIGKQLATTIVSEEAGKRLNRSHAERADDRIYYARDS